MEGIHSQEGGNDGSQLTLFTYSGTPVYGPMPPTVSGRLPTYLLPSPESPYQTCPEGCLFGSSRVCQVGSCYYMHQHTPPRSLAVPGQSPFPQQCFLLSFHFAPQGLCTPRPQHPMVLLATGGSWILLLILVCAKIMISMAERNSVSLLKGVVTDADKPGWEAISLWA